MRRESDREGGMVRLYTQWFTNYLITFPFDPLEALTKKTLHVAWIGQVWTRLYRRRPPVQPGRVCWLPLPLKSRTAPPSRSSFF